MPIKTSHLNSVPLYQRTVQTFPHQGISALKEEETSRNKLEWNLQRTLAKVNYRIHTDAIKENLIPPTLPKDKINFVYADEADMLNMALFGMTAKQWRDKNPDAQGNIRDAATIEQLVVLSNLEDGTEITCYEINLQPYCSHRAQ